MAKKNSELYEIQYTKAADKFFAKHEHVRTQYEDAIRELIIGEHPERIDVKKIKGTHCDYYRIRLGEYRVIYAIIAGKIVVINTIMAGPRGDIYKKTKGMK